jgi:outer membrane immunogenic protein
MTISIARTATGWLACAVAAATAAPLFLSAPAASAADMPAQPRPQAVARPLWTGFYFGVHGGYGWGDSRIQDQSLRLFYDPVHVRSSGPLAGAQIGADWQFGQIVVGGELDASWASLKGDVAIDASPVTGYTTKYRALATGTARVGYAAGSWLGYVKGGVAWTDIEFTILPVLSGANRVVEYHRTGLTAGAGVEVAFFGNLSAKLEYNALFFGETSTNIGGSILREPANVDHLLHVVKGGINLRFGGDHLAARY